MVAGLTEREQERHRREVQGVDRPGSRAARGGHDRDLLLTNVSIYWFTKTAGSSANRYYEAAHDPSAWAPKERGTVPTGVAVFPGDVAIRRFAERDHNVVHWSEFDRGGHFAAMEGPDVFVGDVRKFFRELLR